MIYKGPMKGIPNAWDTVMKKADQANLEAGMEGREVYLKFTTPEAEDNETEIQMGLKP
jgi:effector-binding domain-containing protein